MRVRRLQNSLSLYWQPMLLYGALLVIFGGLLWFRLGSLVGGYSPNELAALQASTSLHHIFEHPLNAPFTLLAHGLTHLGEHGLLLMRATATIFGLLTLSVFYWLVRHWHGERSAILGTIVFGCSAWFLHTARLGTPDVLLFGLLLLVACGVWLKHSDSWLVLLVSFLVTASMLYVPGMVWFIALGVLWRWKTIDHIFKRHLWTVTAGALALLAALAPLGWAIYKSPELAKQLAGLPAGGWPMPLEMLKNLAEVPLNLFWRGPSDPQHWLAQLPILATFSIVMFFLGAYLYARHWRLQRSKLLAVVLVGGTLLVSLGGPVSLSIIIPFVYIGVTGGIGLLLDRWYQVFPRNVIAQAVGMGLVSIAVVVACSYDLRRYLVAWPAVPATKHTFIVSESTLPSDTIKR
jgi:hypothetical protein